MKNCPNILTAEKFSGKKSDFRDALFNLEKEMITHDNFHHLTRIYTETKLLDIRNKILKLLYDFNFPELKDFFNSAYKRERYLDMKLYALRGFSHFALESEIAKLLVSFNQTLAKRQETTPYNYQEYELLRGQNALPYLIEKFGYECFKETLSQVNYQYDLMPDAFKGHFTTDENGKMIFLKTMSESKKILDAFYEEERKKYK